MAKSTRTAFNYMSLNNGSLGGHAMYFGYNDQAWRRWGEILGKYQIDGNFGEVFRRGFCRLRHGTSSRFLGGTHHEPN